MGVRPSISSTSDWMPPPELRERLDIVDIVDDREAELWVAQACQQFGLVASGFEHQLVATNDERPLRIDQEVIRRVAITEPFWRVFQASDRSGEVTVCADWGKSSFSFEISRTINGFEHFHRRAFTGVMFDRRGVEALLSQRKTVSAESTHSGPRRPGNPGNPDRQNFQQWVLIEFERDPNIFRNDDGRIVRSKLASHGTQFFKNSQPPHGRTIEKWLNYPIEQLKSRGFET